MPSPQRAPAHKPAPTGRADLLRARDTREAGRVTFVELFFDLVFVFAVTQLSHFLAGHLSLLGVAQATLLLLAMWWAWIDTSWVTNWLDPEKQPVRLMLFVLMLAGLVLSTSLPEAFADRGGAFVAAYVFMQVGRSSFMLWALRGRHPGNFRNFQRIVAWQAMAGLLWVAGIAVDETYRLALWTAAVAVETAAPMFGFWMPGLGRSTTSDWDVEGGHMAERCGLFIIIALGELVLVTGASFAGLAWSAAAAAAFAIAFIGSVAMWWIYFNVGAELGRGRIAHSRDPGRIARLAYTYIHVLLVAGIILSAVGDELLLAHPDGHPSIVTAAVMLGGPALYLLGNLLFKRSLRGHMPRSHLIGLGMLAAAAPAALVLPPLPLSLWATAALIVVAAWETIAVGRLPGPR